MKKCPFCAEEIQDEAIVCKHCGRDLDQGKRKVRAQEHPSYWMFTIVSLVVPFVGFIIGIVYLIKPSKLDKKVGEHALALSILSFVLFTGFMGFLAKL